MVENKKIFETKNIKNKQNTPPNYAKNERFLLFISPLRRVLSFVNMNFSRRGWFCAHLAKKVSVLPAKKISLAELVIISRALRIELVDLFKDDVDVSMKIIGQVLYEKLVVDKRYNDYCIKYKNTYTIDIDVLKELLVDYKDFYYLFLKSFIFLYYRNNIKHLNKDLQNYYYIGKIKITLDDIYVVLKHYYSNYNRCRKVISIIISNRLRPNAELKLLKEIYNIEQSIVPNIEEV